MGTVNAERAHIGVYKSPGQGVLGTDTTLCRSLIQDMKGWTAAIALRG